MHSLKPRGPQFFNRVYNWPTGSLKPTHVAEQAQQAVLDSDHEYCTRDFASDLGASAALVRTSFPFQLLIGIW